MAQIIRYAIDTSFTFEETMAQFPSSVVIGFMLMSIVNVIGLAIHIIIEMIRKV